MHQDLICQLDHQRLQFLYPDCHGTSSSHIYSSPAQEFHPHLKGQILEFPGFLIF